MAAICGTGRGPPYRAEEHLAAECDSLGPPVTCILHLASLTFSLGEGLPSGPVGPVDVTHFRPTRTDAPIRVLMSQRAGVFSASWWWSSLDAALSPDLRPASGRCALRMVIPRRTAAPEPVWSGEAHVWAGRTWVHLSGLAKFHIWS